MCVKNNYFLNKLSQSVKADWQIFIVFTLGTNGLRQQRVCPSRGNTIALQNYITITVKSDKFASSSYINVTAARCDVLIQLRISRVVSKQYTGMPRNYSGCQSDLKHVKAFICHLVMLSENSYSWSGHGNYKI